MVVKMQVAGLQGAQAALDRATAKIKDDSEQMLMEMLMGISMYTKPYVPVDTSALINSEYIRTWDSDVGAGGEIGYSIDYAVYVHEGGPKNWQKPGASDLFLKHGTNDYIDDGLPLLLRKYYHE